MTDREKIESDQYVAVLSDFFQPEEINVPISDYVFQRIDTNLGISYVNIDEIRSIGFQEFTYRSIPKIYGLGRLTPGTGNDFDPTPLMSAGVLNVQRDPLNLTGEGVVLGFLDTGIRYEEEIFRNQDGTTRILGIWDQSALTGEPPEGLLYGAEYRRDRINEALQSGNPGEIVPVEDEIGHGTAIASVAAGSAVSGGLRFTGAAPRADIVVVKLRQAKPHMRNFYLVPEEVPAYSESDLITGIKYLESYAVSLRRPLVICIGLGTNMGDHEGHSILSGYLDIIATRRSRIVVIGGGDEGNSAHHFIGHAAPGLLETTEGVEIRVDERERGFVAELWGNIPASHAISILSPGGEQTDRVDFKARETRTFGFVYEKTRIRVDHVLVEQGSGEELIFFRFEDPTPGIWTIQVSTMDGASGEQGSFHIWLPLKEFLRGETYFLRPSPYITITEPGNTAEAITTTFYQSANNSFYGESGRGFTRTGNRKPDVCTPGVNISTALGKRTGSAMGAALLSGGCAQFMQWAVVEQNQIWMESRELKNLLIRGAVRMAGNEYPSREWGYGLTDMTGIFDVMAGTA